MPPLLLGPVVTQQSVHPGRAFEAWIELEIEFGRIAQLEGASDLPPDKSARTAKPFDGLGRVRAALKVRKKDAPVT